MNKILKNVGFLYAGQVFTSVLSLLLAIIIARTLGDQIFGRFSLALSIAGILSVFLSFGFDTIIIRDVSRDYSTAPHYTNNIATVKTIVAFVILIVMTAILLPFPMPVETKTAIGFLTLYFIFRAFVDIFESVFKALEKMHISALIRIVERLIIVSIAFALIVMGFGLKALAFSHLLAGLIILLGGYFLYRKENFSFRFEFDWKFIRKITRQAMPIGSLSVAAAIFIKIDTVMINFFNGDQAVGWYSGAYHLILALKPLVNILLAAFFPMLSRTMVMADSKVMETYYLLMRVLFLIALPASVGLCLLSDKVILLIYGESFQRSIPILRIISWDILCFFMWTPVSSVLLAADLQNLVARSCWICAVMNIVLNALLIPILGPEGAAVATVATECLLFAQYFYYASKHVGPIPIHRFILRPVLACVLMAAIIYSTGYSLPVQLIGGAIVYIIVLIILGETNKKEIKQLFQAFSRR